MEANGRSHYIFVDYENVQDVDLDVVAGKPVKVFIIVGVRQKSLPLTLTKQIHKYHDQVQLIETEGAGRNALDMVLAYHIGHQAKCDHDGHFHVLAKDKDYDALIKHLHAIGIWASRNEEFSKIPALVDVRQMSLDERTKWVVSRIAKNKASKPSRKKTLISTVSALCHKQLAEPQVGQIVDKMVAQKLISISPQGHVEYLM